MFKKAATLASLSLMLAAGIVMTNHSSADAADITLRDNVFTNSVEAYDSYGSRLWSARENVFTGGIDIYLD